MKKAFLTASALLTVGCTSSEIKNAEPENFQWQIDRFDDIKVLRYRIPDFDSLSLPQKKLVYYLSQAALCGRDIYFDQNCKYNLPIRRTLEAVFTGYEGDRETPEFKAFEKYLKKIWFANGIHHHYSNEKFTPGFSEAYFKTLIAGTPALKDSAETVKTILPVIFDPELYKIRVTHDGSVDMIQASANNFYEGVTQAEAERFYASKSHPSDPEPVSHGLNSRLVKENGVLTEQVWKIGGMYSPAIEKIVHWLKKAAETAENPRQKATIEALIEYYETGDLKTFDKYSILWVEDLDSQVDFINGFIETYEDPLGYKASWESTVNFKNLEATRRTELLSRNAQWFEDHSPIDDKYKKKEVKGVSAKVITVAQLGGACYPATPIGINLPNADWIRKEYGSKSVTIQNITYAYAQAAQGDGFAEEFIFREKDRELAERWGTLANDLSVDLHECLGHGSGQLAPGIKGDELKNYGSTLEEARADLFALYYIGDPKLVELSVMPSLDVMKTEYNTYMFNGLMGQLTRIEPGKDIIEAHMRNRQLIARWCYEKGKAENVTEIIRQGGKTYVIVNDYEKLRMLFGDLLREIQRIKSEGDFEAGRRLVEDYAVKVDPELHKEILERYAKLDLAPYSGFVNPVLKPVEKEGEIVDIAVEYPDDYTGQMLYYSSEYAFL